MLLTALIQDNGSVFTNIRALQIAKRTIKPSNQTLANILPDHMGFGIAAQLGHATGSF